MSSLAVQVDDSTHSAPIEFDAAALSDDELIEGLRACTAERRRIDARAARLAAEIERRSARDLGHHGLAQQNHLRNGAEFVRVLTGASRREAHDLVEVGALLPTPGPTRAGDGSTDQPLWLAAVGTAVESGRITIAAARSIGNGLGEPSPTVDVGSLSAAAARLVDYAATAPLENVLGAARLERELIDVGGVAEREARRYARRSFRIRDLDDGMKEARIVLDPENGAFVQNLYDQITAPRRGGPRFVDPASRARADEVSAEGDALDGRTLDQFAFDGVLTLLRLGAGVDDDAVVGGRQPGVRVHVAAADLDSAAAVEPDIDPAIGSVPAIDSGPAIGIGHLEGGAGVVSISTVERIACTQGTVAIRFDTHGQVVDLGREKRLFSAGQRIALAARDGGCRGPDCDRPPSWTEAHHIDEWMRDDGRTDVRDGILLCTFHHRQVHNAGARIVRDGEQNYWWMPGPDDRRGREPIPLPSRNPVRRT